MGVAYGPNWASNGTPQIGAGLTIGRDCEKKNEFSSRPTILFRDSAPNPPVFGWDDGHC
jgi:hypothetical protein